MPPRAHVIGQCLQPVSESRLRGGEQWRHITTLILNDARPAQQVNRIDRGCEIPREVSQLTCAGEQSLGQCTVDLDLACGFCSSTKVERAIDFSTTHDGGNRLAEITFRCAQLLGSRQLTSR